MAVRCGRFLEKSAERKGTRICLRARTLTMQVASTGRRGGMLAKYQMTTPYKRTGLLSSLEYVSYVSMLSGNIISKKLNVGKILLLFGLRWV